MSWGLGGYGTRSWGVVGAAPEVEIPLLQPIPSREERRLWGRDLWWDGDYGVSAAGDWVVVDGETALRQSVRRRIVTNPGDWQTAPEYGAGARAFVKAKRTDAAIEELRDRIRAQLLRDERIDSVGQVVVDTESVDDGLKISVQIQPAARVARGSAITVSVEVT